MFDILGLLGLGFNVAGLTMSSKQNDINNQFSKEQLKLQKESMGLQIIGLRHDLNKGIQGMRNEIDQYGIEIQAANSMIDGYDKWLTNFSDMRAQQVQSKQAQTNALMASGKETYNNFLNAIGYSDALAGATGRVGAGTSAALTTQAIDQQLVDYVGQDRILDANGGLFGSQLTAANMEMDQLKMDLYWQNLEAYENRKILESSIGNWENAIARTEESIFQSEQVGRELEKYLKKIPRQGTLEDLFPPKGST